jgi:conjugative relaxase-like TrwC/TraI family protein
VTVKAFKISGDGRYYVAEQLNDGVRDASTTAPGTWAGEAAKHFGVEGRPVTAEAFLNTFAGRSPDGATRLVRNADSPSRQSAHELVVSPDKSFAAVWAAADARTRLAIHDCLVRAAQAVLADLEKNCGYARVGAGGKEVVKAEQLFAVFLHLTSRAQDPLPHFHFVRPNFGRCPDGQSRALKSEDLFTEQRPLNGLFNLVLANELESRTGFKVVARGSACAIEGVPKTLLTEFSTRREQILARTEALGLGSPQSKQIAAYATRPAKEHLPLDDLLKLWRETAERHRFDVAKLPRLDLAERTSRALVPQPLRLSLVLKDALKLLTRAGAAFGQEGLLAAAYLAGIGKGVSPEQVRSAVGACLERPKGHGLIPAGTRNGEPLFHTRAQQKHEARLDRLTRRWPDSPIGKDRAKVIDAISALKGISDDDLGTAARLVLWPTGLVAVTGPDAAARDRVLRTLRTAYAHQGYRTACVSSSHLAGRKAFGEGVPVAGAALFLKSLVPGPWLRAHREALQSAASAFNRRTSLIQALKRAEQVYRGRRRGRPLDDKTVLIVHDTGRIPAADLVTLLTRARSGGAKVVLADGPALPEPTVSSTFLCRLSGRYPTEVIGHGPVPVARECAPVTPVRPVVQKSELALGR